MLPDSVLVEKVATGKDAASITFSDGSTSRCGPEVVVLDRASGRTAYVGEGAPEILGFLREAARRKIPVRKLLDSDGRLRFLQGVW